MVEVLGTAFADLAVRIFLEEMFITFSVFVLLAFTYCFVQPRWLETLLTTATGKLVFVIELIYLVPFVILILAAVLNLLPY